MNAKKSAPARSYDERYFLEDCGGAEFFRAYGARVLKPQLAYCLRRAELRPGMKVLDLGCGRGELLHHARLAGTEGVGADFAPAALALAREVSGCPVLLCTAESLPFPDASFDRVFLIGVVDHLTREERARCFAEVGRVLRPGGWALVHTCGNRLYYKLLTYGLRRAFSRGLRALGLPLREPSAPRSEEDRHFHVNEHSRGDLQRFFAGIGWEAEVRPMPNYKFLVHELYAQPLPEGFPLAPAPAWESWFHRGLLLVPLLESLLARELFVRARPRSKGPR